MNNGSLREGELDVGYGSQLTESKSRQPGFDPPLPQRSLTYIALGGASYSTHSLRLCWIVSEVFRATAASAERDGVQQTRTCAPAAESHRQLVPADKVGRWFIWTSLCRRWYGLVTGKPRKMNLRMKEAKGDWEFFIYIAIKQNRIISRMADLFDTHAVGCVCIHRWMNNHRHDAAQCADGYRNQHLQTGTAVTTTGKGMVNSGLKCNRTQRNYWENCSRRSPTSDYLWMQGNANSIFHMKTNIFFESVICTFGLIFVFTCYLYWLPAWRNKDIYIFQNATYAKWLWVFTVFH